MRIPALFAPLAALAFFFASCASSAPSPSAATLGEPALGAHHRAISTQSAAAQRDFDRGLVWMWAFNHDEAIACFEAAARHDPKAAMPWWGIAFANGPHINNPALPSERARAAWDALEKARERAPQASRLERELIEAMAARYSADFDAPRAALDQAFADSMRQVWRAHPDDADVGTWFAEALADLHPWDLWTLDFREKPGTAELVSTLERVLVLQPNHPGACHLQIHTLEASPYPERALASANRLRTLVPDAGHLVHMPAHIDARLGNWSAAARANRLAIAADARFSQRFPRAGFYRLYMLHNQHFLTWTCMLQGGRRSALDAAQAMLDDIPAEFIRDSAPMVDGYLPVLLHVQLRFGMWDELLNAPEFEAELTISNAVRRYARGVALVALDRLDNAQAELVAFDAIVAGIEAERPIGNNLAHSVLPIPRALLFGELAFRRGDTEAGLESMREAVRLQDELAYNEAPDWMMPSRHPLGAALLEVDQFEEAEAVFRADLRQYPNNGWALFGLQRALEGQAKPALAKSVSAQFEAAWAQADVQLRSPCFCQPGR
jgi:tetratricopeptide (TPR) repeat protein